MKPLVRWRWRSDLGMWLVWIGEWKDERFTFVTGQHGVNPIAVDVAIFRELRL